MKEAYGDHHRYLLVAGNTKSSLAGGRWRMVILERTAI